MSLKTRIDSRSKDNDSFKLVESATGDVLATIASQKNIADLSIETKDGLHIEKPNGFSSKRGN